MTDVEETSYSNYSRKVTCMYSILAPGKYSA